MSFDAHDGSSRLFHYFSIIGLKPDVVLQPITYSSSNLHEDDESPQLPPLKRGYKSYVLGYYPDYVPSTPFDEDAVQMLCLPKGLQLKTQKNSLKPHFHPFVVTKEDGSQYYGFCYTFYEEVNSKQICTALHSLQSVYLTEMSSVQPKSAVDPAAGPCGGSQSLPRQIRLCSTYPADAQNFYDVTKDKLYVSKCIVLIGPYPAVIAASSFLIDLYKVFIECDTDTVTLEAYVYNLLYEVPSPPKGKCMSFTCVKKELVRINPGPSELPSLEYSLQQFFALLGIEMVMQLLTCVLLENQVIILSSDYYKLMLVSECVCSLIFPFSWQNVYVPILPSSLLHFLDAPVPFIMGVQADIENDVIQIPNEANLCLLDVDRSTIEVPEDLPQPPYKQELRKELLQYFEQFSQSNTVLKKRPSLGSSDRPLTKTCLSASNTSLYGEELTASFHQAVRASSLPKTKRLSGLQVDSYGNSVLFKSVKGPEAKLLQNVPSRGDACWPTQTLVFNNAVREIFLNWFVQIFCSYENFINVPNIQDEDAAQWLSSRDSLQIFDKATFLVDQPDSHLPFLSRFTESQLFTSLIDQKLLSGDNNVNIRIFDLRIRSLRDHYDDSVVRSASFEQCSTIDETEQCLRKKLLTVDYRAPPAVPLDPDTEAYTHFNPDHFPLLDKAILNKEPQRSKRRGTRAWQRREKQAQHLEQAAFSSDQRERVLQEARMLAHSHPKLADMSPAHIAHMNWNFVEQLLKECKTRTKKMLVLKMGSEAVELGHGESSLVGVEENTLIASLCDLLERIWGHGLQKKQGKSALWSHLLSYQESFEEEQLLKPSDATNANFLSSELSSKAMELDVSPVVTSPGFGSSSKGEASRRSRSVDRSSFGSDVRSPFRSDSADHTPSIRPLPMTVAFDMKNVLAMPEIKTQIGYARAWVRISLEKKLLSRHLRELLSDTELLRTLYKRYAFLRCEEEKEQFLSYLLSLNAVDYFCFTNKYTSSIFPYRVIIFPSRKPSGATTSARVSVDIGGTLGHTAALKFPKNQLEMTFQHKNLGLLTTLRIGHDNAGISPKWMVEHVLVRNEATGHTWKFPCGRWLGKGIDDGSLERILVGELVPVGMTSEELVEACRTPPPRSRSPAVFAGKRSDASRLSPSHVQQILGDAVNNIVKFFYKPEQERGSLTLLLCGDQGLVRSLELVFTFGFKSTRLFGKNLFIWDYFEKVQYQFQLALREEIERHNITGIAKDDRTHGYAAMAKFVRLLSKINSASPQLGKDDKFQLFVCIGASDHLLHRVFLPLQRCSVTSQMYEECSFLRDPSLVRDLINVLSALSEFKFDLEKTLVKGIE